jgi:copper homeostasis protein
MIRPRTGSFLYSQEEFEVMIEDIRIFRQSGASGVVFGLLTASGAIDVERTKM